MNVPQRVWWPAGDTDERVRALRAAFAQRYGREPEGVWAAPGRANLLGEHIDYSGGTCLPFALPHTTLVAAASRTDGVLRAASPASGERDAREIALADVTPGSVEGWFGYVAGVPWAIRRDAARAGMPRLPEHFGADLEIDSTVPVGAGLSSSAALECAVAMAVSDLAAPDGAHSTDSDETRAALAEACMAAENEIVGAATGGLDQAASLRSRAGAVLALDCRDFSLRPVPVDPHRDGYEFLVLDTRAPHQLADGHYAQRRADCTRACALLGVGSLRELHGTDPDAAAVAAALARFDDASSSWAATERDRVRRRVRHALSEMVRVQELIEMCERGVHSPEQWARLGALLSATHASLRDDYEVSVDRLDVAAATAETAGALGARMVGGGFGGAILALVAGTRVDTVLNAVLRAFAERGWDEPRALLAVPSAPARRVW